jgi:hypothetical protein
MRDEIKQMQASLEDIANKRSDLSQSFTQHDGKHELCVGHM